jgi:hypothetical protein
VYKRFHRLEAYATGKGKVAARLSAAMPRSRHRDCRNVHCVDDANGRLPSNPHGRHAEPLHGHNPVRERERHHDRCKHARQNNWPDWLHSRPVSVPRQGQHCFDDASVHRAESRYGPHAELQYGHSSGLRLGCCHARLHWQLILQGFLLAIRLKVI